MLKNGRCEERQRDARELAVQRDKGKGGGLENELPS